MKLNQTHLFPQFAYEDVNLSDESNDNFTGHVK